MQAKDFINKIKQSFKIYNSKFALQPIIFLLFVLLSCRQLEPPQSRQWHPIWEIKSENCTVYILGSFKYINKEPFPFDSRIERAFVKSSNLAVQLNLNKIEAIDLMNRSGVFMDTTKIKSVLKDTTYQKLVSIFSKHNMPERSYRKVKPWLAVQTAEALVMNDSGMKAAYRVDKHFLGRASEKKVWELESFDFMYRVMPDEWLADIQNEYVEYVLYELNDALEMTAELNNAWENGKASILEKFFFEKAEKNSNFAKVKERLIDRRNRFMKGAIKQYLESGEDFFVVIDIVHLLGEKGIINLLRQEGKYIIKP